MHIETNAVKSNWKNPVVVLKRVDVFMLLGSDGSTRKFYEQIDKKYDSSYICAMAY